MIRQHAGRRRGAAAVSVPTGSLRVTRAISDAGSARDPGDRGERDHLHGIVTEPDSLECDAVHWTMIFANPAVGAAVIVDQNLAGLPAELFAEHRVADLDEAAARGVAILAVDHDVEGFL